MSSILNDIEQNSPGAARRLFQQESPNTTAPTIPATVIAQPAAAAECDDDPRTPSDLDDDRRRLAALEGEVERYRGLLDDVNDYVTSQQAAHDAALASSQAQVDQLLAAFAANTAASSAAPTNPTSAVSSGQSAVSSGQPTTAVSTGLSAVSSGQSADTHPLFAASQQGDCTRNSAVGGAGDVSAVSSSHQSAVSSGHQSAVSSGHNNAAAPVLKQGDCPPADAGSSVNAAQADAAGSAAQTNADPDAATSLAADAATARLKESPAAGSQQGDCSSADADSSVNAAQNNVAVSADHVPLTFCSCHRSAANSLSGCQERCPPADAGSSAYATGKQNTTAIAQNAQDTAAARNDPAADSLAATAATARLMESAPSGSDAYINFGSIIRLLFYRFKSSVIGFLFYRFKYSAQLSDLSGLKFDMASTFDYLFLKE
jgi:hypothetical protein